MILEASNRDNNYKVKTYEKTNGTHVSNADINYGL